MAQLALLSTLNALLTHEPKPPTIIRHTHLEVLPTLARHQTGLWVAQVQAFAPGLPRSSDSALRAQNHK